MVVMRVWWLFRLVLALLNMEVSISSSSITVDDCKAPTPGYMLFSLPWIVITLVLWARSLVVSHDKSFNLFLSFLLWYGCGIWGLVQILFLGVVMLSLLLYCCLCYGLVALAVMMGVSGHCYVCSLFNFHRPRISCNTSVGSRGLK